MMKSWPVTLKAGMLAALFLIAGWGGGLGMFMYQTNKMPVPDSGIRTDAIIVLTGGADRINTGLDLLAHGSAERILISGVNRQVTLEQIMKLWPGEMDNPETRVYIGHMAQNTQQNAAEARQWAEQMYVRSARLVTAANHMPRALLEFRHAMPDVKILPHPVKPKNMASTVKEYNKTLFAALRLRAAGE
jgi:uncharacterized SAM-binding protein YcdF (DUF218 family)